MPTRTARTAWTGTLETGSGIVELVSSDIGQYEVSFPKRAADEADGTTSPEELIAAAHAACFAMALNATVGRKGGSIAKTDVTATVTADKGDAGITITSSKLSVTAHGLTGIPKEQFAEVAKEAEGKCPVSNALRGSLTIELDAKAV